MRDVRFMALNGHGGRTSKCPLCPQKRTSPKSVGMSVKCHEADITRCTKSPIRSPHRRSDYISSRSTHAISTSIFGRVQGVVGGFDEIKDRVHA